MTVVYALLFLDLMLIGLTVFSGLASKKAPRRTQ